MRPALLILAAIMMIGCSKGGSKSRFMDGAKAPEPELADRNFPGPDGNPAP